MEEDKVNNFTSPINATTVLDKDWQDEFVFIFYNRLHLLITSQITQLALIFTKRNFLMVAFVRPRLLLSSFLLERKFLYDDPN